MALTNTPAGEIGWQAPDFTLQTPGGESHGLKEHMGEKGLLIAFICNHCPYVIAVAERFASDAKEMQAAGVNVLAIMSNDYQNYAADSPDNMVKFADKYGFSFPYLVDEDQSVARAYDAVCTPDFFGFNKDGGLQYRGRIDDARMGDASNRNRDMVDAMMMIAETGEGPKSQSPSMGCSIKWR